MGAAPGVACFHGLSSVLLSTKTYSQVLSCRLRRALVVDEMPSTLLRSGSHVFICGSMPIRMQRFCDQERTRMW